MIALIMLESVRQIPYYMYDIITVILQSYFIFGKRLK